MLKWFEVVCALSCIAQVSNCCSSKSSLGQLHKTQEVITKVDIYRFSNEFKDQKRFVFTI